LSAFVAISKPFFTLSACLAGKHAKIPDFLSLLPQQGDLPLRRSMVQWICTKGNERFYGFVGK
jgi:hypothetical protein